MSAFEELGAGLGSLSLGEIYSRQTDDDMDIDSLSGGPENAPETSEIHASDEHYSSDDLPEENSFLHSLSPTVLGAKYALKPRKLLMPPPPKTGSEGPDGGLAHGQPEHDYEFDTSFSRVTKSDSLNMAPFSANSVARLRKSNVFSGPGQQSMFARDPAPLQNPSFNPETPFYGNWVESHPHQNSDSVQIHHHHYYPPQNGPSGAQEQRWQIQKTSQTSSRRSRDDANSSIAQTHATGHTGLEIAHPLPFSQMLPSPWDPHAVPAERTPYVLSSYLQLLVNVVLSCYGVHIVVSMVQAVRQDVAHRLQQESSNLLVEIAQCERAYHENNCSPETIVPALEKMCAHWEKCMHQDPFQIGNRSSVSAHTIGMILNSLVEPLSFKVLVVGMAGITVVFACNFAFGYIRAKTYYGWTART